MEALIAWIIDVLLALALMGLAWGALASGDLFKAIVLFIAFGLVMALVWVRLEAPDIALAEAAIGAGLTGALLLAAFVKLRITSPNVNVDITRSLCGIRSIPVLVSILFLAMALAYAIWPLPPDAAGLGEDVAANLDRSGVSNPVTAVLLNFRSYDTLLEVMVLLLALLGAWSLGMTTPRREAAPGLVLDTLSRLLAPLLILVAAYLLWAGAHAPGGAFQAGAMLAAVGVLMLLTGWQLPAALAALPLRLVLVAGPVTFMLLAVIPLLLEGRLLQLPPAWAGCLILIIETTATISIGTTLIALFLGAAPNKEDQQ
ncbi:hydrogenase subunit MbhD domain-containing protein [Sulfuriflexus sp.]|uniref:hydrogenase subunit MbhD domain-containing protein n=1 Tax=Sulfuriflexus sp. TaxID=2015443 RepID=UPI0028CEE475|nr:hydrogenase subunit MbhD domain-containing protein [Sulfuriflexus sp.]MDT8403437.1 hydrogenase subunit MbhD domain-containing protein [Sulfuriflexus sp.]